MKIVITVEGEKVTVEINSQQLELPLDIPEPRVAQGADRPNKPGRSGAVPSPVTTEEAEMTETLNARRKTFVDPWDCGMCRNAGDLCKLHEGLESEGKKAPKYRHWEASKGAHRETHER